MHHAPCTHKVAMSAGQVEGSVPCLRVTAVDEVTASLEKQNLSQRVIRAARKWSHMFENITFAACARG